MLKSTMNFIKPELISLFIIKSSFFAPNYHKGHATTIFSFFGGRKVKYKCQKMNIKIIFLLPDQIFRIRKDI